MSPDELRQVVEPPGLLQPVSSQSEGWRRPSPTTFGEPGGLPLMSTARCRCGAARRGRLTLAAYHAMGGVRTAVARLAETAFGQLTETQQMVARRILLRLAETGGTPVSRFDGEPIVEVAPDGDTDARVVLDTLAAYGGC